MDQVPAEPAPIRIAVEIDTTNVAVMNIAELLAWWLPVRFGGTPREPVAVWTASREFGGIPGAIPELSSKKRCRITF